MTKVNRYGMKWSTINYWQSQGRDLYRYNGIVRGAWAFSPFTLTHQTMNAVDLAHCAISAAYVLRTEDMIKLLKGEL